MQHSQPVLLIQFSVPKTRSSELCFYIILWNATWYDAVLTILKKLFWPHKYFDLLGLWNYWPHSPSPCFITRHVLFLPLRLPTITYWIRQGHQEHMPYLSVAFLDFDYIPFSSGWQIDNEKSCDQEVCANCFSKLHLSSITCHHTVGLKLSTHRQFLQRRRKVGKEIIFKEACFSWFYKILQIFQLNQTTFCDLVNFHTTESKRGISSVTSFIFTYYDTFYVITWSPFA